MPEFSNRSKEKLNTCHTDLQILFNKVIENYDCTILEGQRTTEQQQEYFRKGLSKLDGIEKKSKHQNYPSLAVDVSPYPIDWENEKRFYHFAGYVLGVAKELDINIRWGGDWDRDNDFNDNRFNDLPHFELIQD